MPPRSKWTLSPISPSATVSARFASAMSRIWRCRTSPSAIFRRCGARSIPVAEEISRRFKDLDLARNLGRLHINISGCINACGHHHIGHIGILGVEKNGEEYYQVTIGGRADENAELGKILGPAVPYGEIADVVEDVAAAYLELRARPDELFIDTVARVGVDPFKERVYAAH